MSEFRLDNLDLRNVRAISDVATPAVARDGGTLLNQWRTELDNYYLKMQTFSTMEPDEIFRSISAWTARASHMRSQIIRAESRNWQKFRTGEIDPFLVECDRQFKLWSRAFSVHTLDWEMSKGGT